jgi:hypothetical protein
MENDLIRIYSGTKIAVTLLKTELERTGISAMIQNDFQSGVSAGFFGGDPSSIDLFIRKSDLKDAKPIINDFFMTNHPAE